MGRQSMTLYGKDKIEDQLSEVTYHISDLSFYQINSSQTEKLYQQALNYAQLTKRNSIGYVLWYRNDWSIYGTTSKTCLWCRSCSASHKRCGRQCD